MKTFTELLEEINPNLQQALDVPTDNKDPAKHQAITDKVRELVKSGKKTGHEAEVPVNPFRAIIPHKDPTTIKVNGKVVNIKTATVSALPHKLDRFFDKNKHGHLSLGQLVNSEENGADNDRHGFRVLQKSGDGSYSHNQAGILPPLLDHDKNADMWSHIGYPESITPKQFQQLTATSDHPNGITHENFYKALLNDWNSDREEGKNPEHDTDEVADAGTHHLTNAFGDYFAKTGQSPYNVRQLASLGNFKVGNENHIVMKDHGDTTAIRNAINDSLKNQTHNIKPK